MQQLFVTGMMRSGTSLVQTLLDNHPQLFVASQPFHQLYVDVKQLFLDEHGLHKLLPLGDGMDADKGEREQFSKWLQQRSFNKSETARLIERSVTGKSGGAIDLAGKLAAKPGGFFSIRNELHLSLANHFSRQTSSYIGSKDAFCEEYVPDLINNGVHCLLVVRDPRAVIASACHGRYLKSVGDRYPLLMLIRLWRKSASYLLALRSNPFVHTIRYEDLVEKSDNALQEFAKWLNIHPFPEGIINQPLHDSTGKIWKGNSSFGDKIGVEASSKETWRTLLTPAEVRFIEACTKPEMDMLGYTYSNDLQRGDISGFSEDINGVRAAYLSNYRLDSENRKLELLRWDLAELGQYDNAEEKMLFLFPEVYLTLHS